MGLFLLEPNLQNRIKDIKTGTLIQDLITPIRLYHLALIESGFRLGRGLIFEVFIDVIGT